MLTINTSATGTGETSGRNEKAGSGETSETGGRNEKAVRAGKAGIGRQVGRMGQEGVVKGNRFL